QVAPANKKQPGVHAKLAYKVGPLYLSTSGLYQEQRGTGSAGTADYSSWAVDGGGMYDIAGFQFMGWYYRGKGVGTTGLFIRANDVFGNPRDSEGFLAQVTYKIGPTKLGLNYGQSRLYQSQTELRLGIGQLLVSRNEKATAGLYYNLTENLLLLGE